MSSSGFKSNPGIHGLASVRGIERVEIAPIGLGNEPIGSQPLVLWLREKMEIPREEGDKTYEAWRNMKRI